MRKVSSPLGETLRCPSGASGAVPTKKMCCRSMKPLRRSSISSQSLPINAPHSRDNRTVAEPGAQLVVEELPRSSLVIPPPLGHETTVHVDHDVVKLVEPLLERGELHAARRPQEALRGHP